MDAKQLRKVDPTRVIVIDTETTGLKQYQDEILSLTVIRLDGVVLFDHLVKPETRKRWPKAQEVHGITPSMVADLPPLVSYSDELRAIWANADAVVGFNLDFDMKFIRASGLKLPELGEFDVMREYAKLHGGKWPTLTECAEAYNIGGFDAHSSLGDTEATRQCCLALLEESGRISSRILTMDRIALVCIVAGALIALCSFVGIIADGTVGFLLLIAGIAVSFFTHRQRK